MTIVEVIFWVVVTGCSAWGVGVAIWFAAIILSALREKKDDALK